MPTVEPTPWEAPVVPELEKIESLQDENDLSAHVSAYEAAHQALQELLSEADY